MMRTLLLSIVMGCIAVVVAWFLIPASTYIENALGLIMLAFLLTAVLTFVALRFYSTKRS